MVAARVRAVVRAARVIVVDRVATMVRAVKVMANVARVMARTEDKVRAVRVMARVEVRARAVRLMAKAEDRVVRALGPIRAALTSIATKTSIVMAMVVVREEAVSHSIGRDLLNRLQLQHQCHDSSLGYKLSLNQKTETKTAT